MKRIMSAVLLLVGAAACGGGGQPKEIVYAVINPTTVAGANADCNLGVQNGIVEVNYNTANTALIYQGDATHWYLDFTDPLSLSPVTIEGTANGSTYTFQGQKQVEDRALQNAQTDVINLTTYSITIKDSGSNNVTGTFTVEQTETCSNVGNDNTACKNQSPLAPSGNTIDCITQGNVQGSEMPSPKYYTGQPTPGGNGSL